jgi:DNA-binding CsgD family transcriptional regulator
MHFYWLTRGVFREGYQHLRNALARADSKPRPARAKALAKAGWLARLHGRSEEAVALLTEARNVAEEAGDREGMALAVYGLGFVDLERGDLDRAEVRLQETLDRFLELETSIGTGRWMVIVAHVSLGQVALARRDADEAVTRLEEAYRRQVALGFSWGLSLLSRCLGDLALDRGETDRALEAYRDAVDRARAPGDRRFLAEAIAGIGSAAVAQGNPRRGARMLAAAATLRQQIGATRGWGHRAHERGEAAARAALPPEVFAAAWESGSALTAEEIIAEALAGSRPMRPAKVAGIAPKLAALNVGLTTRETEVLRLLVRGKTDREIAAELNISARTVGGHVTNLLTKLGVETRTAAAAVAVRYGLA